MTASRPLSLKGIPIPETLDEALIARVVFGFYEKVRADERLGPVFEARIAPDAWPAHLERMCDFWSSILLRTDRYQGHPLQPHLAITEISEAHFERWLALFERTAREVAPPDAADLFIDMARRIARSFRTAIDFHRGGSARDLLVQGAEGADSPSVDTGADVASDGRDRRPQAVARPGRCGPENLTGGTRAVQPDFTARNDAGSPEPQGGQAWLRS
jgi:hemoglobin